jgi:hypothetical protein
MPAGVQLDLLHAWPPFASAANVLGYQRLGGLSALGFSEWDAGCIHAAGRNC